MGWFGNANFHRAQVPFKIWLLRSDKEGQYARVWQCFKFGFPGIVEIKYLNLGFNGSTKNSIASVFWGEVCEDYGRRTYLQIAAD